jgi:hypothetical protein
MRTPASRAQRRLRVQRGTLTFAISAVLGIIAMAASPAAQAGGASHARLEASSHHKSPPKKHKGGPCLEGKWNVTSITLTTTGLTFTGGAGTTVDIMTNGNALGNFTPGTPLAGSAGSAKFNGTVTDHYGFSPKTTAHSGTFPVTTVSDAATITVGGLTRPVTSSPEQGSYTCSGKNLSLTFTSGGNTLAYKMVSAG